MHPKVARRSVPSPCCRWCDKGGDLLKHTVCTPFAAESVMNNELFEQIKSCPLSLYVLQQHMCNVIVLSTGQFVMCARPRGIRYDIPDNVVETFVGSNTLNTIHRWTDRCNQIDQGWRERKEPWNLTVKDKREFMADSWSSLPISKLTYGCVDGAAIVACYLYVYEPNTFDVHRNRIRLAHMLRM